MLPLEHPDRIQIAFDDHRLVNNAGLLLPAALAQHVGLHELVDRHLDLGDAPGRANAGDKMPGRLRAGRRRLHRRRRCLRAGGTLRYRLRSQGALELGTFLRSFRWGHVRQLDRVSRELLARAWAAATRRSPLTWIRPSARPTVWPRRVRATTATPASGAILPAGDVLMARLREGRANTVRGAAHFLRETVGRVRYAGARRLTVRADSGFYAHAIVAVPQDGCPLLHHHPPAQACVIEAIPRRTGLPSPTGWTAPPMWPRPLTFPSGASPMPRRCGSSSGG